MNYRKLSVALVSLLIAAAPAAFAEEIDAPTQGQGPQGLVVRTDASGNTSEVYKVIAVVTSQEAVTAAATAAVKPENLIAQVTKVSSELDAAASSEAWCGWGGGWGWNSGYSWFGVQAYYPSYNWNWGGYSYWYYSSSWSWYSRW
jgi:hypothetical protein